MTTIDTATVTFTVNGRVARVRADHPHLLAALREELDITSPKDGCSPSGQCGCFTIFIDGKAQVSCQYPVAKAEGREIITVEGLPEEERDRFARAFAACGGLQCGFCIPGIVVRAKAQIDKKGASLTREEMSRHLGAHLCGAPATSRSSTPSRWWRAVRTRYRRFPAGSAAAGRATKPSC